MLTNIEYIKNSINNYFYGTMSKEELDGIFVTVYKNIILNDEAQFYIGNILLNHFLHQLIDEYCDEDLKEFQGVLDGKVNFSDVIVMKIPPGIPRRDIGIIKKNIENYELNKKFADTEYEMLKKVVITWQLNAEDISVADILYDNIIKISKIIPFSIKNEFICTTMHFDVEDYGSNQDFIKSILTKLKELTDCYEGNKPVVLSINLTNGKTICCVSPI